MDRDQTIFNEITRWRFCLGRQLKVLAGFTGQRACDRRLSKLIEVGYLERKHLIFGVPGLYFVTRKSIELFNLELFTPNVRIEQIHHDIAVIDTAVYLIGKGVNSQDITTERQLKHLDGFGNPKHQPDFVYSKDGKTYCVEIELSAKKQTTLENNIKQNYLKYDVQQWIIPQGKIKIMQYVTGFIPKYTNIEIIPFEEVQEYVKKL